MNSRVDPRFQSRAIKKLGSPAAGYLIFAAALQFSVAPGAVRAAKLGLTSPSDYQVFQRENETEGAIRVQGNLSDAAPGAGWVLEARLVGEGVSGGWRPLPAAIEGGAFKAAVKAAPGGWLRFEARASSGGAVVAEAAVEHVGVGEVFVVAGQSNSANYGEERLSPKSGKVASYDGERWRLADDPQPGAGGEGGSFMPPFGDRIAERFGVPVGFVPCGIGATSVREWLPKGATFPVQPTLIARIRELPGGVWESKGQAFDVLVARMKAMGPGGFRAVLWHQGESDANQPDPPRTLPGPLYREYMERLIRDSNAAIGWDAPWFVAQTTYHAVDDPSSPEIRAAQASLWRDGVALEGPDTDALVGEMRENGGKGIHFSGAGLREHAARWAEKVIPWIEKQQAAAVAAPVAPAAAQNSAAVPAPRDKPSWIKKHEAINARVAKGDVDLLWIGDSIVEHWTGVGKPVWARYYEPRRAANLGISGDCTEHVLWRIEHGNIDNVHPKLAIVMIGQNNGPHNTAPEIGEGVLAIVDELRRKLPETKILLLAIFFRGEKPNEERLRLAKASEIASKAADGKNVFYLDVNHIFLNPDGSIPKALMPDFEHPSLAGHRVWAEAIEPTVARLLGDAPVPPGDAAGE